MPNLVSLTHPSLLYWAKFRQEYFCTIAFSKGTIFAKNADFFAKKKYADISKIKVVVVLKGIFSKTTYVYVLTYQISSF